MTRETSILIPDPPIVTLRLGSTLIADDIKESDDIYFECDIKANPPWRKLSWLQDVSDERGSGSYDGSHVGRSMINNEIKVATSGVLLWVSNLSAYMLIHLFRW